MFKTAALVSASVCLTFPSFAQPEVVIHENRDAEFVWQIYETCNYEDPPVWLDVTQGPEQDGSYRPHAIAFELCSSATSSYADWHRFVGAEAATIARDPMGVGVYNNIKDIYYTVYFALCVPQGIEFGPVLNYVDRVPAVWDHQVELSLGDPCFIALRLELDDGVHYGWVELRRITGVFTRTYYKAVRWAYETVAYPHFLYHPL